MYSSLRKLPFFYQIEILYRIFLITPELLENETEEWVVHDYQVEHLTKSIIFFY